MYSETELRASISRQSKFKKVYLLLGNDPYLVKNYAEKIAKKCVGNNADLNLVTLPENASVQQIYDSLMQFSFTGDSICVLSSNYPFESCPIGEFKKLLATVEEAPDNNVLVLYFDVLAVDTKKQSSRLKNLLSAVEKSGGMAVELNHKTQTELIKILNDAAAKRFVKFYPAAAKYMISVCSNDLNILINELEKLTSYLGNDGVITNEVIDKVCTKTLEASVFDLSKHIINGRGENALLLLNDLFAQGITPAQIFPLISEIYVDIFRVKSAVKDGRKAESIAEEFGYPKNRIFLLNNALQNGKSLNDNQISEILKELLAVDALVKSDVKLGGNSAKTALECLITKILKISKGAVND